MAALRDTMPQPSKHTGCEAPAGYCQQSYSQYLAHCKPVSQQVLHCCRTCWEASLPDIIMIGHHQHGARVKVSLRGAKALQVTSMVDTAGKSTQGWRACRMSFRSI